MPAAGPSIRYIANQNIKTSLSPRSQAPAPTRSTRVEACFFLKFIVMGWVGNQGLEPEDPEAWKRKNIDPNHQFVLGSNMFYFHPYLGKISHFD